MGIDGLLKFLRPVTQKQHISTFKNQRAGIDVMTWIYRGCYSCNSLLSKNIDSNKYLYYMLQMIQILNYYNIKPIFVFDGRNFEHKKQTNQKRIKQKQQYKAKAIQLQKQGKIIQANKYYQRAIFIDQKIISTTINILHTKNIQYLIAPYQADCQIVKLKKQDIIDVAISQDSDLIAYGINTILKLNKNGDCDYLDPNKWSPRDVQSVFLKQYFAMNFINRLECAILAGTDYNPSIKGIGIKRAVKHMYRQTKMIHVINKLRSQKIYTDKIPQNYHKLIEQVKMIFLFATVYNPNTKQLQYLNPQLIPQYKLSYLSEEQLLKIVGEHYSQYIQLQVYNGKTRAKDLIKRNIQALSIRELFSVNKQNMLAHQTINKKRRFQQAKLKEQRDKMIENGEIKVDNIMIKRGVQGQEGNNNNNLNNGNSKNGNGKISPQSSGKKQQQTQSQKEKRKQQRKNRIIKLQDVMNAVVTMLDQEQEEQKKQKQQKQQKQKQKQKNAQNSYQLLNQQLKQVTKILGEHKNMNNNHKQYNINNQNSQDDSQDSQQQDNNYFNTQSSNNDKNQIKQQSESIDLAFLNPFAKNIDKQQQTASKSSIKNKKL